MVRIWFIHYRGLGLPAVKTTSASAGDSGDVNPILGQEDPPEQETATHCSIPAQEVPWTEEPSAPQSRGSKRVTQQSAHPAGR